MAWYAIYDIATGALKSTGTSVNTENLPEGAAFTALAHEPTGDEAWNPTTHVFDALYKREYVDAFNNQRVIKKSSAITDQDQYNDQYPNISKFQFLRLFTQEELGGLLTVDVPLVKIAMMLFQVADLICLTDATMIGLMTQFVAGGLLTQERATQILAGQLPA